MVSDNLSSSRGTAPRAEPPAQGAVLVVEDHPTYRALMSWFLQKLGVEYTLVGDGRCALAAIACRDFDLVISDCQMPLMDGYTMAREIRLRERDERRKRVPIIVLTAHMPRHCDNTDIDAWLPKPLAFAQLCEVLERWLPGSMGLPLAANPPAWEATWPTRASLIKTFGSEKTVNRMLESLLREVSKDSAALAQACHTNDKHLTAQRLHRLIGSLAFLGDGQLEPTGMALIEQVRVAGVAPNTQELEAFKGGLRVYLAYLRNL